MATLRKRELSVDTATPVAAAEAATREKPEARAGGRDVHEHDDGSAVEEEPVSPTGRLFREPRFNCYIVCVLGLGAPVDLTATRAWVAATLARHPRFCSVQVTNELDKDAKPKWIRTRVNLDDHIIVPELDPAAQLAYPDTALEDYVSSLSTRAMDHSRPLWELHVLDFPTAESAAAIVLRAHHSLGDGVSLLSLLLACTRSAADPDALPSLPGAGRRAGPLYALPWPNRGGAIVALVLWVLSLLVLAWHTMVDVACFVATAVSLVGDARTVLKGAEFRPRRFVNHTLRLDDVKYVKNAMSCTVNDVLLGITSSALSRYYLRRTGKNIRVRSAVMVNLRPAPGLHALASMMESGKDNAAKWGNHFGYMIIPIDLAKHDDPVENVRTARKVARRKKSSLESVFTYWSADMVVKLFGIKAAAELCYGMFRQTTLSFSNMVGPTAATRSSTSPPAPLAATCKFYSPNLHVPCLFMEKFLVKNLGLWVVSYGKRCSIFSKKSSSVYGLTVHYQSYVNIVKVVLSLDEEQFPDPHDFAESLRAIRDAVSRNSDESQDGGLCKP